jgi:hydroxyethylthiazole kinase
MADDIAEAADIAAISSALVLNIGTLNARTVERHAGGRKTRQRTEHTRRARPGGAGASQLRNDTTKTLINT